MLDRIETEKALTKFAKYVKTQAKTNLTRKNVKDTGKLHQSIDYDLNVSDNSFSLAFLMEDYGMFKDLGVQGKTSNVLAPNSPYKFGSGRGKKGGLSNAILEWVKRNKIQFRDLDSGKFTSYKSTAFLISRAIYHRGLRETKFITKPFEKGFERLPDQLVEAFGLDVDNFLKYTINENYKP